MINLQIMRIENVTVLEVSGRIETTGAAMLDDALNDEVENGNANLVLDLSSADFIDSTGLRALVSAYKRVKRVAGDLRLVQPSYPVYEVLRITGMVSVFRTFQTQADAVGSY